MGNKEIIENISRSTGISKDSCKCVIEALADEVTNALCNGESVMLRGFMSLEPSKRSARTVKDLNTGEFVTYPEVKTIKCKMSRQIKDAINE